MTLRDGGRGKERQLLAIRAHLLIVNPSRAARAYLRGRAREKGSARERGDAGASASGGKVNWNTLCGKVEMNGVVTVFWYKYIIGTVSGI